MSSFFDAITGLPTPFNMVVLVVLIGCAAGVCGSIAKEIRKYLCHRGEIELKREMLDRGMESPEIEQVMRARSGEAEDPRPT